MFNDQLLSEYADTFLGYGNQNGKFCFIGLEEGIGGSFEDIKANCVFAMINCF